MVVEKPAWPSEVALGLNKTVLYVRAPFALAVSQKNDPVRVFVSAQGRVTRKVF